MSNQRRVEESPYEVGLFAGAFDAVDELNQPSQFAPWVCGGFPSERGNIRRVPGKVMASTGTLGGSVLTLSQIRFRDSSAVIVNRCGTWYHETAVQTLKSPITYAETLPPTDRFILE